MKRQILLFFLSVCVGVCCLLGRDLPDLPPRQQLGLLCDAMTVPAVLLLSGAGLIRMARQGALDGIGYGLKRLAATVLPGRREMVGYMDYVNRNRKENTFGRALLRQGVFWLTGAAVLLALYCGLP